MLVFNQLVKKYAKNEFFVGIFFLHYQKYIFLSQQKITLDFEDAKNEKLCKFRV
jgi:hypothetical protein